MHWWGWDTGGWWWLGMIWMMLLPVLVLVLVVYLIVWAARSAGGPAGRMPRGTQEAALEIARLRYARGEITREQYLQLVEDLQRGPAPPASGG